MNNSYFVSCFSLLPLGYNKRCTFLCLVILSASQGRIILLLISAPKGTSFTVALMANLQIRKLIWKKQCVSPYYYYKEYCLIILLALVDADYGFIQANVCGNGPASDAGIYKSDYYM